MGVISPRPPVSLEGLITYKITYNIVDLDFIFQELLPILCQISLP